MGWPWHSGTCVNRQNWAATRNDNEEAAGGIEPPYGALQALSKAFSLVTPAHVGVLVRIYMS